MRPVEVLLMHEAGPDCIQLKGDGLNVRIIFADSEICGEPCSKEESARFFRGLEGKPVAIPLTAPFFIAVDVWPCQQVNQARIIPLEFKIASIERSKN